VVFLAGWASRFRCSRLGALRAFAVVLSSALPAVVSLLGVVVLVGSMQLGEIIRFQREHFVWNVFLLPLPFLIYVTASLAEIGRSPYDIAEAESEIVAGYHTEYSGMKFGLFYAVELANALILGGIFAILFFGGWWTFGLDRIIPGWLLFLVKMLLGYWLFVWARGTVPRLRIDQALKFSWQFLIPIGLLNVLLVALEVASWAETDAPGVILLPFAVVNWLGAAGLVVGYVRLLRLEGVQAPRPVLLTDQIGIVTRVTGPVGAGAAGD